MKHFIARWCGIVLALAYLTIPAPADTPGRHPAYLHALSDLRYARALLNRPDEMRVVRDQRAAIDLIDKAIYELKNASYDDRKNPEDHPPIDAHWLRAGRIHRSIEVLNRALHDVEKEEDNPAARGWRNSAIGYMRDAAAFAEKALRDEHHFE
jgi:hypothetical protein